jgi:hypothetical protein
VSRRILEINDAERAWIADNQQVVRRFAVQLGVLNDVSMPLDPAVLDAAWAGFLRWHVRGQEDPNSIINAFGIAFGVYIADRVGLEWRIVSETVTEIALCRPEDGTVIYPQNIVARHYVAGTEQFFGDLAREMEQTYGLARGGETAREAEAVASVAVAPAEAPAVAPAVAPDGAAPVAAAPADPKAGRPKKATPDKPAESGQAVGPGRPSTAGKSAGPGKPVGPGRPGETPNAVPEARRPVAAATRAGKPAAPVDPHKPSRTA